MKFWCGNKKAFTLIELVMAIVIVGIMGSILSTIIYNTLNTWIFMKDQRAIIMDGTSVMQRMTKEMRNIRGSSITIFTSSECQFTDIYGNSIDYSKSGANILRNGAVMIDNLSGSGLVFAYYDKNGASASSAPTIKNIQITISLQKGKSKYYLQSTASIRNK